MDRDLASQNKGRGGRGQSIEPPSTSPTHSGRFKGLLSLLRGLYARTASGIGTTIFIVFILVAIFGPFIASYGPNQQIAADARKPPSASHWFGTDNLGRDIFSRVVLGARDILSLAGLGTLLAAASGISFGLISGYLGGWFDEILMRIFDSFLSIPALLFSLLLLGTIGPSRNSVLIVIFIAYTPIIARVVRSVVLSVKPRGFVEAARLRGESLHYILFWEILPSVLPALAVELALRFSYAIFLVASLGFLGVGVQPPSPDWGLMVKEAREYVNAVPWALYIPAGAIALVVIGVNLMADGIKRVLQQST
ncbi:MAG: ABC transporter permease [Chloroflexota bacterium]|nr:MAG: ABC transporter permease [Chloroflexota bacterium]